MQSSGKESGARFEDWRFITGHGRFTGDLRRDGLLHARFARSSVARGRLQSVDVTAAGSAPGVVAVFTVDDLVRDGLPDLPQDLVAPRDDGGQPFSAARPFLAREHVRFVGEPIALVVAESAMAAADAAELIAVEIDDGPPVIGRAAALAPGAARVWAEMGDNVAFVRRLGDEHATRDAMAHAAHVTRVELDVSRVVAATMEPRAALGECDAAGRLTLTTSTQAPFALRNRLADHVFGVDRTMIRVVAPDVGGSFGMKGGVYREDVLVLWAARKLGHPVSWVADRTEAFLSDDHGRDVHVTAELALNERGEFTALSARFAVNVGAYLARRALFMTNNIGGIAGVYRTPAIFAEILGFHTNTGQVAPYRGAGRPEATYVVERLIDEAARELGVDAFDLRRRNLITPDQMPFRTGLVFNYDCGDFPGTMDRAAELAKLDGFRERRAAAEAQGRLRGIGIANPIEIAAGPLRGPRKDMASVTVAPDGRIEIRTGAVSTGQGHETGLARMVGDMLGAPASSITYRQADTDLLPEGRGAGGSAALAVSGPALLKATQSLIEAGRMIAAGLLEADAGDIEFRAGSYVVAGTDRAIALADIAGRADVEDGLSASDEFLPEAVTYPNGCHIAEVEIEPETGAVRLVSYTSVEDIGTIINPALVDGQMHGGVAQGAGQALAEAIHYDPESGQLLTATFLDYRMPRASDMPELRLDSLPVPTAVNPLGVKGVGEAGTVGSLTATLNAVNNALASAGAGPVGMPATPGRIWAALKGARGGS